MTLRAFIVNISCGPHKYYKRDVITYPHWTYENIATQRGPFSLPPSLLSSLPPFHKYLFRVYDVPGTIFGTVDTEVSQKIRSFILVDGK